jgi:hypothetical protein
MPKEIGRRFDGAYTLTISVLVGFIVMTIGVLLTIFIESAFNLIFGLPLIIIGLLIPIAAQLALAGKRD